MQFHFQASQSHFHMKGFALTLALKQRHKGTLKWPIYFLLSYVYARTGFNFSADDMKERPILTYHRMIEAFNFVAAKETYLADPRFSDKTDEVGNNFQVAR